MLAERRGKWVNALQVQIRLMRKEKIEMEAKFKEEHSQWERERDGLTKQLRYQETQSERRLAWIESLKVEVETQEKEKKREKERFESSKEKHLVREKELRWNVWQRDETARRIRMDADSVFKWFLESIANLAGTFQKKVKKVCRSQCFWTTTFTSILVVIIAPIYSSFFFECVLLNHTFQNKPKQYH